MHADGSLNLLGYVAFVHFSAYEYLHERKLKPVHDELSDGSLGLACLHYLTFHIPPRPLAGSLNVVLETLRIKEQYPFLEYATKYWLCHIRTANALLDPNFSRNTFYAISELLGSRGRILAWTEALYRFKASESAQLINDLFEGQSPRHEGIPPRDWETLRNQASSFVQDLDVFQQSFGQVLESENSVHELWTGMTDFLSGGSQLNKNPENHTECLPTQPFTGDDTSRELVRTETAFSSADDKCAVISIWRYLPKQLYSTDFLSNFAHAD